MFYAEISKQFGTMPFNLRLLPEEGKARMGVVECLSHKLIDPFQVLYEKSSECPSKSLSTIFHMMINCPQLPDFW